MAVKTKRSKTERGFAVETFTDLLGHEISTQDSSSGRECRMWLGIDDVMPEVKNGDKWEPMEIPETHPGMCLIHNRLHINKKQARTIVSFLKQFIRHGKIKPFPEMIDQSYCEASVENETGNRLWLGCKEQPLLIIPADDRGWRPLPWPEDVEHRLYTRMLLDQERATVLVPILEHFIKNGSIWDYE
jgi:hypothetical protein